MTPPQIDWKNLLAHALAAFLAAAMLSFSTGADLLQSGMAGAGAAAIAIKAFLSLPTRPQSSSPAQDAPQPKEAA